MPTYKIDISYNGTNFHGFQQQPKNRTIQGEILEVLDRLIDNYELNYSGRTDSGVHAKSQIISVRSQHELNSKFVHSFNSLITNEIRMNKLSKVKDEFNPRFDAKSRVYRFTGILFLTIQRNYLFQKIMSTTLKNTLNLNN